MPIPETTSPSLVALVHDVAAELLDDPERVRAVGTDAAALLGWIPTGDGVRGRSSLTRSGAPFELSVKTRAHGGCDLRWVADVAEPDRGLAGNRDRYLQAFAAVEPTGAGPAATLLDVGLAGAPADVPPRVMVGVGHAPTARRTTLYLPTSWWEPRRLRERLRAADPGLALPEAEGAARFPGVPDRVEVVGWDFHDGAPAVAKTYRWLPSDLDAMPTGDDDAASHVVRRFGADVPAGARAQSGFLQLTGDADTTLGKLFFFSRPWGWSVPAGLLALLRLAADLGVDLRPLQVVREVCARHGLAVEVGLVAVGGAADDAVVTWYFWPVDGRPAWRGS